MANGMDKKTHPDGTSTGGFLPGDPTDPPTGEHRYAAGDVSPPTGEMKGADTSDPEGGEAPDDEEAEGMPKKKMCYENGKLVTIIPVRTKAPKGTTVALREGFDGTGKRVLFREVVRPMDKLKG